MLKVFDTSRRGRWSLARDVEMKSRKPTYVVGGLVDAQGKRTLGGSDFGGVTCQ